MFELKRHNLSKLKRSEYGMRDLLPFVVRLIANESYRINTDQTTCSYNGRYSCHPCSDTTGCDLYDTCTLLLPGRTNCDLYDHTYPIVQVEDSVDVILG